MAPCPGCAARHEGGIDRARLPEGAGHPRAAMGSDKSSGYFHQSDRNRVDQNKQKALFCLVCTLCTLPLGNLISPHASCFYL